MPSLTDAYEPEHLDAAKDRCERIHEESGYPRRGSQTPCRECLSATEPDEVFQHIQLLSGWWTQKQTPTGWVTVAGPFPGFVEAWQALT